MTHVADAFPPVPSFLPPMTLRVFLRRYFSLQLCFGPSSPLEERSARVSVPAPDYSVIIYVRFAQPPKEQGTNQGVDQSSLERGLYA